MREIRTKNEEEIRYAFKRPMRIVSLADRPAEGSARPPETCVALPFIPPVGEDGGFISKERRLAEIILVGRTRSAQLSSRAPGFYHKPAVFLRALLIRRRLIIPICLRNSFIGNFLDGNSLGRSRVRDLWLKPDPGGQHPRQNDKRRSNPESSFQVHDPFPLIVCKMRKISPAVSPGRTTPVPNTCRTHASA